ncbi:MAG: helix-turn-helix domain-containing protein [Ignavibacteria bacterium]|nr:helix-turn-helix domain-containing protein [Ignavibacteria bacterium]
MNYLYKNPVTTVAYLVEEFMISKQTANTITADFVDMGILKEVTGQKRNRLFVFEEYLNLFK